MKPKSVHPRFQGNELAYVEEVLSSGFKAGADGAFSTRLEKLFAETHNQKFAIAFNSGTSTLHAMLLSIGCKSGDEVLVPSLTPLMCGLSIYYTGATPVYVDVDESTFLMDPVDLESKITSRTKAILVVHMYGAVCDLKAIAEISNKYELPFLEDCAQCHRGIAANGAYAGTQGIAGSWSFENSKQLTSGDGGIVTTDNEELAIKIRKTGGLGFKTLTATAGRVRTDRDKLQNPEWERFDHIGYNYRMNQLAAAVALAQVERQDEIIKMRIAAGNAHTKAIENSELLSRQAPVPGTTGTYYTFSSKFNLEQSEVKWEDFRKKYMSFGGDGIYAASKLLYQEPIFKELRIGVGTTPRAEKLQKRIMNFTTNQLNEEEIEIQVEAMYEARKYFGDL